VPGSTLIIANITVEVLWNVVQLNGLVSFEAEIDTAVEQTRSVVNVQSARPGKTWVMRRQS